MTVKSNFKLDKRINSIDDIQTIICNNLGFIGCKGFFFDNFVQTKDLTKCKYGTLVDIDVVDNDDHCFKARDENGNDFVGYYRFFIPEDALKSIEKKYRPYNISEFVNQYSLGDEIIVRLKDKESISHKLFVEYDEDDEDDDMVCLGSVWYDLIELYDSFEIYTGEGWKPFGVEE